VVAKPGKKAPRSLGRRIRLAVCGFACLLLVALLSGCQAISYYRQAIAGQCQILTHEKSIHKLIADPATPAPLKAKFESILKIRQFAEEQLHLPAGKSYLYYVDLHRPYVVWNVNIAPALSLEPVTWWFPVVGRASYRGYFNGQAATNYATNFAAKFAQSNWDIYIDGIETYSTLGWFKDPLLNTFIDEPETYLAEIIFHELTHRRLFIAGDTDFNEALATFVSMEGVRRWYLASGAPQGYDRYKAGLEQDHQFVDLITATRAQLQEVYTDPKLSDPEKLTRKQQIITDLRARHNALKASWGGKSPFDEWFAEPINNAKLNTISAYYDLVPAFAALLRADNNDLEKFFQDAARLRKLPLTMRHQELQGYLNTKS
jgi:predicted aminopeptidase